MMGSNASIEQHGGRERRLCRRADGVACNLDPTPMMHQAIRLRAKGGRRVEEVKSYFGGGVGEEEGKEGAAVARYGAEGSVRDRPPPVHNAQNEVARRTPTGHGGPHLLASEAQRQTYTCALFVCEALHSVDISEVD